jgi:hypothetical protein
LCSPDPELVYAEVAEAFALAGLGPITEGYSVVATRQHIASAADAIQVTSGLVEFAESVRSELAKRAGSCLLTEHGRLPVCVDISGTSDSHCYHAHFLLFPGAPDITPLAASYFRTAEQSNGVQSALELAAPYSDYLLVSPNAHSATVMTRPGRIIRQFARVLVADSLGRANQANWRKHPNKESAIETAASLRKVFRIGHAG